MLPGAAPVAPDAGGAAAVGAGVAAVGTAAAVAATSPYWGSGPYYAGSPYYAPGGGPYASYDHQRMRVDEYARRNGMVCTPGTWFKGDDGLQHPCQ